MKFVKNTVLEKKFNSRKGFDLILVQGDIQLVFFLAAMKQLEKKKIFLNPLVLLAEMSVAIKANELSIINRLSRNCDRAFINFIVLNNVESSSEIIESCSNKIERALNSLDISNDKIRSVWYTQNWTEVAFAMADLNSNCIKICYGDKGNFGNRENGVVSDFCISPFVFPANLHSLFCDSYVNWDGLRNLDLNPSVFEIDNIDSHDKKIGLILLYDRIDVNESYSLQLKWVLNVLKKMPESVYLKFHPRQNDGEAISILNEAKKKYKEKKINLIRSDIFAEFINYRPFDSVLICAPLSSELVSLFNKNVVNVNMALISSHLWMLQIALVVYKALVKHSLSMPRLMCLMYVFSLTILKIPGAFGKLKRKLNNIFIN
jgi:hypothetical protein